MDHLKTSVLAMLFVIFILNKQKFSVITSFLLDKCLGRRKDVLAYRENFSSKCALFFVLGKKKKKKNQENPTKTKAFWQILLCITWSMDFHYFVMDWLHLALL